MAGIYGLGSTMFTRIHQLHNLFHKARLRLVILHLAIGLASGSFFASCSDWLDPDIQSLGQGIRVIEEQFHNTLSPEFLSNLRFQTIFLDSSGIPENKQADLHKGIALAMKAWASVIEGMNVTESNDSITANFSFVFGNFNPGNQPTCCKSKYNWTGYSSWPTSAGTPTRDAIYLNTYGKDSYEFSAYNFVSRTEVYASYIPASFPPEFYHLESDSQNLGYRDGRFSYAAEHKLGGTSIFSLAFHEFGHSLGIRHRITTPKECRDWYTGSDFKPNRIINRLFPKLAPSYIGGGTWDTITQKLSDSPASTLRGDSKLAQVHMMGTPWDCNALEPGIPQPPYAGYNNRVVFAEDVVSLPPLLVAKRNALSAIIILEKVDGSRKTVQDWDSAVVLSQYHLNQQNDPFFVQDIQLFTAK